MPDRDWVVEKLVEQSGMTPKDVNGFLEKLATLYGFSNFLHLHRFMSPDIKVEDVVYDGKERRVPLKKGTDR